MMKDVRDLIYGEGKPRLKELNKIVGSRDFRSRKLALLVGDSGAA